MLIIRSVWTRRNAVFLAAAVVILLAYAPFLTTRTNIDYDTPSVTGAINNCLGDHARYDVDRVPGTPVYVLTSAALLFWLRKFFGGLGTVDVLWVASIIEAWIVLVVFYRRSKKLAGDHWITGLMLLSLALHPVFIWQAFSVVEDIFALACFALALLMARRESFRRLTWIFFAMGVGSKFSLVGLLPMLFAYVIDKSRGADVVSVIKQTIEPLFVVILLSVLFILPAAAHWGMDPTVMFKLDDYGTTFNQRVEIGWFMTRSTILWWLPFGFYLIIQNISRMVRRRRFMLVEMADIPLVFIFMACLAPWWGFNVIVAVASLVVTVLYYLRARGNPDREFQFSRSLLIVLSVPCSIVFMMLAPFSRSYVLFALVPILVAMALRCRSVMVWILIAALSYGSMFHYMQVSGKKIIIHKIGYYEAFLKKMNCHFNDWCFVTEEKNQTVIYFPGLKE